MRDPPALASSQGLRPTCEKRFKRGYGSLSLRPATGLENECAAAHSISMETTIGSVLSFLVSIAIAAVAASMMLHVAFDTGLSREEVRGVALVLAVSIGALLAIAYYSRKLRGIK